MKIIIDIPEEFEKHSNEDRFEDSLKRIMTDVNHQIENELSIRGLYEIETCEMLIEAFKTSVKVKYILAGIDLEGVKRGTKRVIEWND